MVWIIANLMVLSVGVGNYRWPSGTQRQPIQIGLFLKKLASACRGPFLLPGWHFVIWIEPYSHTCFYTGFHSAAVETTASIVPVCPTDII